MIKVTYQNLLEVVNAAGRYITTTKESNKLTYACARLIQRFKPIGQKVEEELEDFRAQECALTDDKGAFLMDGQNFRLDKAGMLKLTKKQRDLNAKAVEIEPYITTQVPSDLRDDYKVIFEGFLIPTPTPTQQ